MSSYMGAPKQLTWSGSPPTSPLTHIVSMSYDLTQENQAFLDGDYQFESHWQGKKTATLTVTSTDIAKLLEFEDNIGCVLTNVVATWHGAVNSCGESEGSDVTRTFSRVIINKVSGITGTAGTNTPCVGTVEFMVSRDPQGSDPTVS